MQLLPENIGNIPKTAADHSSQSLNLHHCKSLLASKYLMKSLCHLWETKAVQDVNSRLDYKRIFNYLANFSLKSAND